MSRTIVYIDGLNLYYQALKWSSHKWLNLEALTSAVLPANCNVLAINLYVADVSGRVDPDAPRRQQALFRALKSTPIVSIHKGNFLSSEIWTGLVRPLELRPVPIFSFHWPHATIGKVHKSEEKGSDVNLGAHLVRDAFQGKFDTAAVLTNDTDLKEPIRIVVQELGLPVILLTPIGSPARSLRQLASDVRHIKPYLGACQFPNPVILPNGQQVHRPKSWASSTVPNKKRKYASLDFLVKHRRLITISVVAITAIIMFAVIEKLESYEISFYFSVITVTLILCTALFGWCRRFRGY